MGVNGTRIAAFTAVYWGLGIIVAIIAYATKGIKKGGIIAIPAIGTAFSLWLLWLFIYLAQMNPVLWPILDIAH